MIVLSDCGHATSVLPGAGLRCCHPTSPPQDGSGPAIRTQSRGETTVRVPAPHWPDTRPSLPVIGRCDRPVTSDCAGLTLGLSLNQAAGSTAAPSPLAAHS